MRWTITRAAAEAEALAGELRAQGLEARALPCIEREDLGWPPVPEGALLFLTSAAVLPIPEQAARSPVAALAKVAQALKLSGREVLVESGGGAVALANALAEAWQAVAPSVRAQIFYPHSDLAPEEPEHAEARQVLERCGDVTARAVYRVAAPPRLAERVADLGPGAGLVFFSPSAVRNFLAARPAAAPARVVAFGGSTARAWNEARPAGWPEAALHPRDLSLAETLRRQS